MFTFGDQGKTSVHIIWNKVGQDKCCSRLGTRAVLQTLVNADQCSHQPLQKEDSVALFKATHGVHTSCSQSSCV